MDIRIVTFLMAWCAWVTTSKQDSQFTPCPKLHSCQLRDAPDYSHYSAPLCYCDALCNTYSDCCFDAEYRNASQQIIDGSSDFRCYGVCDAGFPIYVKRPKCKEGWTDRKVEARCLKAEPYVDHVSIRWAKIPTDPLSSLLVTSKRSGITYENYYCAICNEDVLDLRLWRLLLYCDVPGGAKVNPSDLAFNGDAWGVLYDSSEGGSGFQTVYYRILPPDIDFRYLGRSCPYHNLIETCPDDWPDEEVAARCHSYTAIVSSEEGYHQYKNLHCALCNNMTDYACVLPGKVCPPIPPVSFIQLFDFADPSNNLVGSSAPCSLAQGWDPFFKRCRSIVCPEPHQDYKYGKCEDESDVDSASNDTHSTEAVDSVSNDTHSTKAPPSTNLTSEFLECHSIVLMEGEFVFLDNGSAYVAEYNRSYSPGEYAVGDEGSLLVCLPDEALTYSRKFSAVLGWVSMAGLGLSCTALLLHLAVFALLPELRNLSGKNLASLCLALLAAYVTFLVNALLRPGPSGCLVLAAAMYYFFVTSFTWMNVIAFDVWYTFCLKQRQFRRSSGAQWQRFIAYSLYSWLLPAAATLALLLVNQFEPRGVPEEFLPRLGRTWCWFSHRKALLAFFAAPIMTIIVVNGLLFASTAANITHESSTAAATSSVGGGYHQGHYKVYLRLAVLMGFTWVSGIAAGYLSLEPLWYVFVLLNTLQGVFIFLAFTVKSRVWQGVAAASRQLLQRGLSRVTRRPPPSDNHGVELNQISEQISSPIPTSG